MWAETIICCGHTCTLGEALPADDRCAPLEARAKLPFVYAMAVIQVKIEKTTDTARRAWPATTARQDGQKIPGPGLTSNQSDSS